jgi:glycosyltransferase involved in cell wall biosynthesis
MTSAKIVDPIHVVDWDILTPVPTLPLTDHQRMAQVRMLVRLGSEPLGYLDLNVEHGASFPDTAAASAWSAFKPHVDAELARSGLPTVRELPATGLSLDANRLAFVTEREDLLANAPEISVVLCTRDRPDRVAGCIREVARQRYPAYEIVVVDNAPADPSAVPAVLKSLDATVPVRYVTEPRGGLSWARNAGWRAATSDIIAFLDDDEIPDEHWLVELVRGFSAAPAVGCVTGLVLPAELRTQPQQWFEQLGGFRQGRGFVQEIFHPWHPQSPLYPFPPFGAGANMAFRRGVLADIGGFDVALGAGTPAKASEETLAFARARLADHTIVYQPTAMVAHYHRETLAELKTQLHNYSIGTTAYYTALILWRPRLLLSVLRLVPRAVKDNWPTRDPARMAAMRDSPAVLIRTQFAGMLKGPLAYLRSSRVQRRLRNDYEANELRIVSAAVARTSAS